MKKWSYEMSRGMEHRINKQNWTSKRKRKCGKYSILICDLTRNFPELMRDMNHHFGEAL